MIKKLTYQEWTAQLEAGTAINGVSPGSVAASFGCSRQYVDKLIKQGKLDAVRIYGEKGRLMAVIVPEKSIERWRLFKGWKSDVKGLTAVHD